MIRSFGSKDTAAVWTGKRPKSLPPDIIALALRKLNMLSSATQLKTLSDIPGNRLEQIRSVPGLWSIRISQKYRIIFWWDEGWAENVEIVDYKH
jgi:proteic killer suppression protein